MNRSSRLEVFCKKGVLRKFTGKHLCQRLFFNKIADLRPEAWDLFLQNTSGGCFCSDGFNWCLIEKKNKSLKADPLERVFFIHVNLLFINYDLQDLRGLRLKLDLDYIFVPVILHSSFPVGSLRMTINFVLPELLQPKNATIWTRHFEQLDWNYLV